MPTTDRTPPPGTAERIAYLMARAAVSPAETVELTGLSLSSVRRAMDRGELPVVRIGRRVLIPTAALLAMLDAEAAA